MHNNIIIIILLEWLIQSSHIDPKSATLTFVAQFCDSWLDLVASKNHCCLLLSATIRSQCPDCPADSFRNEPVWIEFEIILLYSASCMRSHHQHRRKSHHGESIEERYAFIQNGFHFSLVVAGMVQSGRDMFQNVGSVSTASLLPMVILLWLLFFDRIDQREGGGIEGEGSMTTRVTGYGTTPTTYCWLRTYVF